MKGSLKYYAEHLTGEEFVEAYIGKIKLFDPFIERLFETDEFLATQVAIPEIIKEAGEYFIAGKFTKRELVLIDLLKSLNSPTTYKRWGIL